MNRQHPSKEDSFQAVAQEVSQAIEAGLVALRQTDRDPRQSIQEMTQSPNLADFWAKVSSSFRTNVSALASGRVDEIMGRQRS